jgi:hypothetical protein
VSHRILTARRVWYWFRGWNITIIATASYAVAAGLNLSKRAAFQAILSMIWVYTLSDGTFPAAEYIQASRRARLLL